jgi:hypothetical protein
MPDARLARCACRQPAPGSRRAGSCYGHQQLLGGVGSLISMTDKVLAVAVLESAMAPMISAAILAPQNDLEPELANTVPGAGILIAFVTVPIANGSANFCARSAKIPRRVRQCIGSVHRRGAGVGEIPELTQLSANAEGAPYASQYPPAHSTSARAVRKRVHRHHGDGRGRGRGSVCRPGSRAMDAEGKRRAGSSVRLNGLDDRPGREPWSATKLRL